MYEGLQLFAKGRVAGHLRDEGEWSQGQEGTGRLGGQGWWLGCGSGGRTEGKRAGGVTCTLSAQSRSDELGGPSPGVMLKVLFKSNLNAALQAFPDPSLRGVCPESCCPLWAFPRVHMVPVALTKCQDSEADALSNALLPLSPSYLATWMQNLLCSRYCTKYSTWIFSFNLYKTCRR